MLRAAIGFFVIGLVAFAIGASGIGGLSMEIGRILLFVFIALAILSFLASIFTGKKPNLIWIPIFFLGLFVSSMLSVAQAEESTKTKIQDEIGDVKTETKVNSRRLKRYVRNKSGKHSITKDSKDVLHDGTDRTKNAVDKVKRETK